LTSPLCSRIAAVPMARIRGTRRWRRDRDPTYAALVSAILVDDGSTGHLGEAIESVIAQSYPHVEPVVAKIGRPGRRHGCRRI